MSVDGTSKVVTVRILGPDGRETTLELGDTRMCSAGLTIGSHPACSIVVAEMAEVAAFVFVGGYQNLVYRLPPQTTFPPTNLKDGQRFGRDPISIDDHSFQFGSTTEPRFRTAPTDPQLRWIDVSNTPNADLSRCAQMPHLHTVYAANSGVRDLTPLRDATKLATLDVSRTRTASVAPLAGHRQLRTLNIAETDVRHIAAVAGCPLEMLDATRAPIDDLDRAPAAWVGLRQLSLAGSRVGKALDLQACVRLATIDLGHLALPDLACVEGLRFSTLAIPHTPITDLEPIKRACLAHLDVRRAPLRSLTALQSHQWTLRALAIDVGQAPMLLELDDMLITHLSITGYGQQLDSATLQSLSRIRYVESIELVDGTPVDLQPLVGFTKLQTLAIPATSTPQIVDAFRAKRPDVRVVLS